ncbi:MAG TPA: class I SAM-dependent methyltransferase [Chthoniobacteraceae bacterium]|jgi:2-polyprenyl-3-methyl-5-hydroxy-6-metoxy-1,4-benzoquinol methylase|nr:class I SAM-dependent methyltransferase [Chthoniobacteraceae bacterium]
MDTTAPNPSPGESAPASARTSQNFEDFESLSQCPVCGAGGFQRAFEPDVVQCQSCKVYFRNPRPTQDEIRRSYDVGSNYAEWQKDDSKRDMMWRRRLALLTDFKPSGRLLDVGAGDGYFLDRAKEAGFETYGTELSETGAEYARQRGHQLLLGQIKDVDFKGLKFDVITLWHVLEHLPNPGEALSIISNLLRPGGIFGLAVPNEDNHLFRHRIGLKKQANPLGLLTWSKEIHLTHFQPSTLKGALAAHGFKVRKFGVDDIYWDRSAKNMAKLKLQKSLSSLFEWHFSMAMYCVCTRE